jgi:Caspase domain
VTLVVDRGQDGPRVHALCVAVGAYRHLPRGHEEVKHNTLGLKQLSGPPPSALAFVDWLASHLTHPSAQLGTIELLLSPAQTWPQPRDGFIQVEMPSLLNTVAAFERWYGRCDSNEGNVALFYFCGHGVEKDSQYLLLEDFGRSELRLLENSVDVGATYLGMARSRARAQYFFVDACREIPFDLLNMLRGDARTLIEPQYGDPRQDTALLFATSGGAKAYGRRDSPTRFTEALIRALGGLGGRRVGDRWVVDYSGLHLAVTTLLRNAEGGAPLQSPTSRGAGEGILHVCPSAPVVPVTITCDPAAAVPAGQISLAPLQGGPASIATKAYEEGWKAEAPADVYRFTVDFPDHSFRDAEGTLYAYPPESKMPVSVAR